MEVHEDPDRALCDGPNMLGLEKFPVLAKQLTELHGMVRGWDEQ